jgi:hypothetical protein
MTRLLGMSLYPSSFPCIAHIWGRFRELPCRILAEYGPSAVQSALQISETLSKILTDSSSPVGEGTVIPRGVGWLADDFALDDTSIAVVLFIGRIALDLAETSPFIRYLCRQQDTPEGR